MPPAAPPQGRKRPPLPELIQSEEKWAQSAGSRALTQTVEPGEGITELDIEPYGAQAQAAFRARFGQIWSDITVLVDMERDSMEDVMRRVENILRISKRYWTLCAQHYTVPLDVPARECPVFASDRPIARVCALKDVKKYLEKHPDPVSWRLQPPQKVLDSAKWQEKAVARFNLLHPFPEQYDEAVWKAYYEERSSLEQIQITWGDPDYSDDEESSGSLFKNIIRSKALGELLEDTVTEEDKVEADKISDGILYLYHDGGVDEDGDGNFRAADLFVRIYPLHTLTVIDVAITYEHRIHWSWIDYMCIMAYRLRPPSSQPLGNTRLNPEGDSPETAFKGEGWKLIFHGFATDPVGRHDRQQWPAEAPVTPEDVRSLASALLGTRPARRSELAHGVLAVQVLMSALTVHVNLDPAVTERQWPEVDWEVSGRREWLDAKLRVICGVGTDKDREMKAEDSDDDRFDSEDEDDEDDEDYGYASV